MPETDFEESDSGVGVVARGEVCIELAGEPLQFGIAPVGIVGRTIATRIGAIGFLVIAPVFDILRHCRSAPLAIHFRIIGVLVAEAEDGLVSARRDIVQNLLQLCPIVINLSGGLSFDHTTGQSVVELHGDGMLILRHPLVVAPQH